jgi:uncharacterized RDD family membrane protein YckC
MQAEAVSRDTVSAGFGERFVAILIDAILLAIVGAVIRAIFTPAAAALVELVVGVGYYTYFWTSTGQTLGKMAMGLKVVKADGGDLLDFGGAIIRYIGYIISGIPVFLGFLWALWDPKHDTWHDKIAGTKVIKVER